jgi:hypothetical protein
MQINTSVTSLLAEWGKWSNAGLGLTLNAPSEFEFVDIDDDLALLVDKAIALLGVTKPKTKAIVMMYYRNKRSCKNIGINVGLGETKTKQLLVSGEAWLEGHLLAKGILIQNAA